MSDELRRDEVADVRASYPEAIPAIEAQARQPLLDRLDALEKALRDLLDVPHGRLNAAKQPCKCAVHEAARAALRADDEPGAAS